MTSPRRRVRHRPPTTRPPIWTAFVILMMLASMFSSLVDPVFAQGEDGGDTGEQQQTQQDPPPDRDGDGIPDDQDSCPDHYNLGTDWNADGVDDACDPPPPDRDGDGIPDDQDSCPDHYNLGTDWNADGVDDACDPPPTPTATHTPTPGMGTTQEEMGAQLYAYYWECPADYDPATGGDRDTMTSTCNLYDGDPPITFELLPTYPAQTPLQQTTSGGGNSVMFDDVEGDSSAQLSVTSNMEPAKVFCESHDNLGNGSNTRPYASVSSSGQQANVPVDANHRINCDWFVNAPPAVDIIHTKYVCPPDYDVANTPLEQLRMDCDEPVEGYSFVVQSGQYSQEYPTDEMANNSAAFMDVPAGMVTMYEVTPPGHQFLDMWCYAGDESDPMPASYTRATVDPNGRYSTQLDGGYARCDWFNTAPQYETNYMLLYKYVCDLEVRDGAPTQGFAEDHKAYYDEECMVVEGWEFEVGPSLDMMEMKQTDRDGKAVWEGLPAGNIYISETLPPDSGPALFFCRDVLDPNTTGIPQWSSSESMDGTFTGEFASEGMGGECHVYNFVPGDDIVIQQQDDSNLTIHKWICPPNYDWSAAGADPMMDCATMAPDGITFTISDEDPNTPDLQSDTGDQSPGNGYVYFGGLQAGMHTITEQQDPAYASAFLWNCDGYQNLVSQPISEGWTYQMDVPPGMDIDCHWMNVPAMDEGFSVTLYKWLCPVDTMTNQTDPSYYNTECATQHPDVPFTLMHGGGSVTFESEIDGYEVNNVIPNANGQFTLIEEIQPGYGEPVGYCQPVNGSGGQVMLLTNGILTVTVPPNFDDDFHCWYYNIPMDEGFSVTLYKWECPAGTMYGNPDPSYYSGQCATEQDGVPFSLTDANGTRNFTSDTNGHQENNVVPTAMGQFILMEGTLDGFGDPVGFCQPVNGPDGVPTTLANGLLTVQVPPNFDDDYHCWYYNIPDEPGMVTIYKWECPEGMEIEKTLDAHQMNCTIPLDQVTFTLTDSMGPRDGTTMNGVVEWNDVRIETITVAEHIPLGYSPQPYVSCRDADPAAMPLTYNAYNGVLTATLTTNGQHVICDWFNQFQGPGELTVYKWECPVGYDRTAWGADPATDCNTPLNGVTFTLDQPQDVDLQTTTGDSINGAVYFGGLMPGDYVLHEMVPDGIVDVFVLDCVGMDIAYVHPIPLSVGPSLSITVGAGDQIRCDWYNVPGYDPAYGWLMLTKYQCSTPKYVSDIDCLLYTGGQEFDLQAWNGSTWTTIQSGTTNGAGQLTFAQLDPGTYRLTEPGKTACLIKSDRIENGQLAVVANGGTTVKVYNCGTIPVTPKTPTKYPDTGIDPSGNELRTMNGLSLLGLLGTGAVISRRRLLGAAALGAGTVVAGRTLAAQDVVPLDAVATPSASPMATPGIDCMFPATPEATPEGVLPGTPVACARGAVPVRMRIPAIEVDAPIEYLEFIDGTMEQPTGETNVAWYKNSARLGEQGNGLYAGHLNWWGVPQAVFYRLAQVPEGEAIEIEGDNGETYRYLVQWKQDFPSDEEPPEEALGHTQEQAITVITCGGEWNAGRAEYDHRTLVRAVRDIEAVPSTPVS